MGRWKLVGLEVLAYEGHFFSLLLYVPHKVRTFCLRVWRLYSWLPLIGLPGGAPCTSLRRSYAFFRRIASSVAMCTEARSRTSVIDAALFLSSESLNGFARNPFTKASITISSCGFWMHIDISQKRLRYSLSGLPSLCLTSKRSTIRGGFTTLVANCSPNSWKNSWNEWMVPPGRTLNHLRLSQRRCLEAFCFWWRPSPLRSASGLEKP